MSANASAIPVIYAHARRVSGHGVPSPPAGVGEGHCVRGIPLARCGDPPSANPIERHAELAGGDSGCRVAWLPPGASNVVHDGVDLILIKALARPRLTTHPLIEKSAHAVISLCRLERPSQVAAELFRRRERPDIHLFPGSSSRLPLVSGWGSHSETLRP